MALKAQRGPQPLKWALQQLVSLWLLVCLLDWINSDCGGKGLDMWLAYKMMIIMEQQQSQYT